jgi:endonuclease/exonuclease/phosphatase family metal-dependent hydrolase
MTLNIWHLSGPWPQRRAEIVAWLDLVEPDVVCLQEVIHSEEDSQAGGLAEAAAFRYHVAYGASFDFGEGMFGNAVLSRWPIDDHHRSLLPYDPDRGDMQRVLLHARTRGLDVFCTHLTHFHRAGVLREAEVAEVVRVIEERADPQAPAPPILAGDFNAEPDSTEIRHLCGLASLAGHSTYFQDAWRVAGDGPGITWDNRNPFAAEQHELDRRLDYVFAGWRDDGPGRVGAARVVCDRPLTGTFASDHFGLVAEVTDPP